MSRSINYKDKSSKFFEKCKVGKLSTTSRFYVNDKLESEEFKKAQEFSKVVTDIRALKISLEQDPDLHTHSMPLKDYLSYFQNLIKELKSSWNGQVQ